jgi:hypothetical protein
MKSICNIKDNIMRELYYQRKLGPVQSYELPGVDSQEEMKMAINELKEGKYLITDETGVFLEITVEGKTFCETSSFCCKTKPIVLRTI